MCCAFPTIRMYMHDKTNARMDQYYEDTLILYK